MRAFYQVVCYIVTLAVTGLLSLVTEFGVSQETKLVKQLLGNKPLPALTDFFIHHRDLPMYLFYLPWLAFIALPLVSRRASRAYWDPAAFLLRFATFASIEAFIFLTIAFAFTMPFISLCECMGATHSQLESVLGLIYWVLSIVAVLGAIIRTIEWWKSRARQERSIP
jgi:hypothetical protein